MTCVKDVGVSGNGALLEPSITNTVIDPFLGDVQIIRRVVDFAIRT